MNDSEKNTQISATGSVSDEYHEKIEQAEEGQWVAYLDLMGTSIWFEANKNDPSLNKKVKDLLAHLFLSQISKPRLLRQNLILRDRVDRPESPCPFLFWIKLNITY